MQNQIRQQIVISGVGGQGVLFITRLLAEAAIQQGLPVFTSETHGMAQRGGTVLSHLKVGDFSSPLIRPGQADGLLALKAENMAQHAAFLKPEGWAVVNGKAELSDEYRARGCVLDADRLATEIDIPRAVNLIVMGAALSPAAEERIGRPPLFCNLAEIKSALNTRLVDRKKMQADSLTALNTGFQIRF
jgi:indolepyruvate ferredoxin oxidoreductase beta subunit